MQLKRAHLSTILAAIPSFDQKAIAITELISSKIPKAERSQVLHQLHGLLQMLQVFNVISISRSGKVKAETEVGTYFLRSFARYVKKNFYLVSSWDRPELDQEFDIHTMMNWGSNFLYLMEHKRVKQFGDRKPIRFVDVVQLVIKAKIQGSKEPMYLMQYDMKAHVFQLIGGIRRSIDKTSKGTIQRQLAKELPLNTLVNKKTYEISKIIKNLPHETLSPTYGAYSRYNFDVYQLKISLPFLKLGSLDRWVTYREIKSKVTHDGVPISDIDYHKGHFQRLPLSLENEQPPHAPPLAGVTIAKQNVADKALRSIIKKGETEKAEFKSSFRYDYVEKKINKGLEKPSLKTIAAFLNSGGGTLLIGVDDNGAILGLERDFASLPRSNNDGFSQTLFNVVTSSLGIEFSSFVQIKFGELNKKTICIVTVTASPEPVFVRDGQNREFYVRAGTTTKLLNSEETFKYIALHW